MFQLRRLGSWILVGLLIAVSATETLGGVGAISQTFPPDARSRGMGDAFTAIAAGPSACWWNPAALAIGPSIAIAPASYSKLVPDLADDVWIYSAGAAGSAHGIGVGMNLNYLDYGDSEYWSDDLMTISKDSSHESVAQLGAGIDLVQFFAPENQNLHVALGGNLKRFSVDLVSPYFLYGHGPDKATAWDIDLAGLTVLRVPLGTAPEGRRPAALVGSMGAVLSNVFDSKLDYGSGESDHVGRWVRLGVAGGFDFLDMPDLGYLASGRLAADLTKLTDSGGGTVYNIGAEGTLLGIASLRVGYVNDEHGAVKGVSSGAGLGLELHDLLGLKTLGGRLDWARIPQAEGLTRPNLYSASAWTSF
jgi:hypothetical protein